MSRRLPETMAPAVLAFFALVAAYSSPADALSAPGEEGILRKVRALQVPFIENRGQLPHPEVRFYARTFGGALFVTARGEMVYSLPGTRGEPEPKRWVIRESLVNTSVSEVKGEGEAVTRVSSFRGNDPAKWRSNVSTYNLVNLGEVYDGIELKLKAYGNSVEKLFYVEPGADTGMIMVEVEGAEGLSVNEGGELEVWTGPGLIRFSKPLAYHEEEGKREYVEVAYSLKGEQYGFQVWEHDRTKALVIDPLLASTYLGGGSSSDYAESLTLDGAGNVYLAGRTFSADFPATAGAYDTTAHGGGDAAFVSKLDPSLSSLLASTYLGGSGDDRAYSLALDGEGNVYLAGRTFSADFPATAGAYDTAHGGYDDAFVSKLDSALSRGSPLPGAVSTTGPAMQYFGSVSAGATSMTQLFTFTNEGQGDILLTPSITGANASEFSIWMDNCSGQALVTGAACQVAVYFSPVSTGDRSAYLTVPSDDPNSPAASIELSGVGVEPGITQCVLGDLNGDGVVNILDVILNLQITLGCP